MFSKLFKFSKLVMYLNSCSMDWVVTKDMGSKLRYGLRKVLGTQNHPTLRLASHHCVLCLNPIKGTLNTCI